jgi:broad specificity phosphatase PhoE
MKVSVTYFVHGATKDNERHIASGWSDVGLSMLGKRQSVELRDKIKGKNFDVVFCSDLKRSVDSARLAFGGSVPVIKDRRLRECNYGDMNGEDSGRVESMMPGSIDRPFPNGESYKDVENRTRDFLRDLLERYPERSVAIVAHRAPQLALDVILKGKTWEQAMKEDWRLRREWKPGWSYVLKEDSLR